MPRKRQGYVKKRKGFHGVPSYEVKKRKLEEEKEEGAPTASERKLEANKPALPHTSACSPTHSNSRRELDGFYLISGQQLKDALQAAHVCNGGHLIPLEDGSQRDGLNCSLILQCSVCGEEHQFCSSPNACEGAGKSAEINKRATLAGMEVGLARAGLEDMTALLGTPPPVTCRSYMRHVTSLSTSIHETCEDQMSEAAERLREKAREGNPGLTADDVVDVAVSYDGTWHRRGHVSNHGVGAVISLDTGEVIDREVLSKVCKECEVRKGWDKTKDKYKTWWAGHEDRCFRNHKGSSGKMEVDAAVTMWKRSVSKHKIRYRYMLCDGDSSSFNAVRDVYGEGHEVRKVDCVGHVGKRMYKALDTVRKQNKGKLADGKGVGRAKGRLRGTSDTGSIGRLCKLYRSTIRKHADKGALDSEEARDRAVEKMRRAILAILYHSVKLPDPDVRHQYCPDGENTWCEYKKSGKEKDNENHLDPVFLDLLLPTFSRLSKPDLLERCLPGMTQNQNESFHALIWKRCPKHLWRGPRVVRTAVDLAVLAFNCGAQTSRERVFHRLNLSLGAHATEVSQRRDNLRKKRAKKRAREEEKKRREALRKARKARDEEDEEREGGVYSMGAFS
ncbi:uncharacterized protein [Diadema setosum]|uniref:uncharacterized protein n=1 Tax=Diadema setosum TaxID=31175 RepID=UPI003B3A1B25